MHIVILEDDETVGQMMAAWLDFAGHTSSVYTTGAGFMENIAKETTDLIVVDWELPDINGDKVLVWLRENLGWDIPVIFVTGNDNQDDIVSALEAGADDYMIKPVDNHEWLARIKGQVRRKSGGQVSKTPSRIEIGNLIIDIAAHNVSIGTEDVSLTRKEFEVTLMLVRNLGKLISREDLMKQVWEYSSEINTRTVDTHVSRIRKKLSLNPENDWRLSSIYNYGYRLEHLAKKETQETQAVT